MVKGSRHESNPHKARVMHAKRKLELERGARNGFGARHGFACSAEIISNRPSHDKTKALLNHYIIGLLDIISRAEPHDKAKTLLSSLSYEYSDMITIFCKGIATRQGRARCNLNIIVTGRALTRPPKPPKTGRALTRHQGFLRACPWPVSLNHSQGAPVETRMNDGIIPQDDSAPAR